MNIVNIGTDKTLIGGKKLGDAIERHQAYGQYVDHLDIIVYSHKLDQLKTFKISDKVIGHPTNSWLKTSFIHDAMKIFKKINQDHKVDLIVCQDPFIPAVVGQRLKKKYGCKLQINFHGDFFDNQYWLKEHRRHRLYRNIAEKTIHQADTIRVVSEGIKQKLIKRGIESQDIYVIPTPVNLDNFEVSGSIRNPDRKIVLTVGRIVKAKDFPTLIEVAKKVKVRVPELEWQIIGDGPLLESLKKKTSKLQFIKWLGGLDHQRLKQYYSQSYLVAITSTNESFGKVFLEAAMARKPSIATNTVGAREIIQDGESGYLVPIGNVDDIAERVIYLLQQPQIATQMGQKAYEVVKQKFGWQKSIEAMVNMWRQTVGKR